MSARQARSILGVADDAGGGSNRGGLPATDAQDAPPTRAAPQASPPSSTPPARGPAEAVSGQAGRYARTALLRGDLHGDADR